MRAEREARSAAWYAEQAEKKRIHEERLESDPAYKEEWDRAEMLRQEADAKWYAEYMHKQAKREARRSNAKPRYRALTAEEQRAEMREFREGYADGGKVGLDTQIDKEKKGAIR